MLWGMLLSILGVVVAFFLMFVVLCITEILRIEDSLGGFIAAMVGITCILVFLFKALSLV